MLMLLTVFIFAVIGMNTFGTVKIVEPLHARLNFSTFSNSMMAMFRICTGEGWSDLVTGLLKDNSNLYHDCLENPTYYDYIAAGNKTVGCGSWYKILIFFFSYLTMMSLIFLNLFIAIILNGYYDSRDELNQSLNTQFFAGFKEAWASFDPDATGFIELKYFKELMFAIPAPIGWDDSFKDNIGN
jgi:hypothetical protein